MVKSVFRLGAKIAAVPRHSNLCFSAFSLLLILRSQGVVEVVVEKYALRACFTHLMLRLPIGNPSITTLCTMPLAQA